MILYVNKNELLKIFKLLITFKIQTPTLLTDALEIAHQGFQLLDLP